MSIDDLSRLASMAQAIGTVIAFVIGGIWTYTTFIRRRQKYPHAVIEHVVSSRPLMPGKIILSVDVSMKNQGNVLLRLTQGETTICQMVPPPQELLDWLPTIKPEGLMQPQYLNWAEIGVARERKGVAREIEPAEVEALHYDFILADTLKTVRVTSTFPNDAKRHGLWDRLRGRPVVMEWERTTIYDVRHGTLSATDTTSQTTPRP